MTYIVKNGNACYSISPFLPTATLDGLFSACSARDFVVCAALPTAGLPSRLALPCCVCAHYMFTLQDRLHAAFRARWRLTLCRLLQHDNTFVDQLSSPSHFALPVAVNRTRMRARFVSSPDTSITPFTAFAATVPLITGRATMLNAFAYHLSPALPVSAAQRQLRWTYRSSPLAFARATYVDYLHREHTGWREGRGFSWRPAPAYQYLAAHTIYCCPLDAWMDRFNLNVALQDGRFIVVFGRVWRRWFWLTQHYCGCVCSLFNARRTYAHVLILYLMFNNNFRTNIPGSTRGHSSALRRTFRAASDCGTCSMRYLLPRLCH